MIEELTLRNFKSYKTKQKILFTSGVNKISGRNATGKTTILEAILFSLYGEVPSVNKKDLVTLGNNDLYVSLTFFSPITNKKAVIVRGGEIIRNIEKKEESFKSTDLFLDVEGDIAPLTREKEIQNRLRELLGVGRRTFLNVVYARQKEFIDILNPDKNRMNAILGLTAPTEIKEQLKEVKKVLEERGNLKDKNTLDERIRNAEENIKENNKYLSEATDRKIIIQKEIKNIAEELEKIKRNLDSITMLFNDFKKLDRQRTELELTIRLYDNQIKKYDELSKKIIGNPEKEMEELLKRQKTAEATEERLRTLVDDGLIKKRRQFDAEIGSLRHKIDEHTVLSDSGLTECPTCGQPINKQIIEEDLAVWKRELDENCFKLQNIENEIQELNYQTKIARERRIEVERSLINFKSLLKQLEDLKIDLEQIESKKTYLTIKMEEDVKTHLANISKELAEEFVDYAVVHKRIENEMNNLIELNKNKFSEITKREGLLSETNRIIKELEKRINTQEIILSESKNRIEQINEYQEKIRVIEYIIEQYGKYEKDIRENTLRRLEDWTFEYFKKLTDQQLYSRCLIDREKYTLEVQLKDTNRTIPTWRAGGGHESIFALAERLALLRVSGFPYLLILDEPTDAIDSDNIPQLLEYISKSTREINQILLVTHHGQGEDEDINLLTITKENGESKIF